jgi:hypothetical protein
MAKKKVNGMSKKTLQSNVSKDEYNRFQKQLQKVSADQNINITESAYIRKLILDDMKKGDRS